MLRWLVSRMKRALNRKGQGAVEYLALGGALLGTMGMVASGAEIPAQQFASTLTQNFQGTTVAQAQGDARYTEPYDRCAQPPGAPSFGTTDPNCMHGGRSLDRINVDTGELESVENTREFNRSLERNARRCLAGAIFGGIGGIRGGLESAGWGAAVGCAGGVGSPMITGE